MPDTAFIEYLQQLQASQPSPSWDAVLQESQGPSGVAILIVDLVRGFCDQGPLASPRVNALLKPTAAFLSEAYRRGVDKFLVACDCHPPDSPEFRQFPPHCLEGTAQAELAPTLAELPFAAIMHLFSKRSLNCWLGTDLEARLRADLALRTLIVVGDCTDLCVHQAALTAQLMVNQHQLPWQIMVVSSLVDTYDLPLEVAHTIGALPHPADFLNRVFFYHMHLNGVRVVRQIV